MREIVTLGTSMVLLGLTQLVLAAEPTSSSRPLDFKGLSLGTSPEEARTAFLAAMTSWICQPGVEKNGTGRCMAEGMTFAQAATRSVEFDYAENRLGIVVATIDQKDFSSALSSLRTKYGAPSQSKQSTVANLTGARLPQIQHTWTVSKAGSVTATLRGQSMDTAEITYRSAERVAADDAQKKSANSDI